MTTDTTERGFERLICTALTGHPCDPVREGVVREPIAGYGGVGWSCGNPRDDDREFCVDRVQLAAFLHTTQPEAAESHCLGEDGQVDFNGKAKGFVRTHGFLSSVLPYSNADWEKRSIFLNFLVSKLLSAKEEDLSKGILDAIDMDSYRVQKRAMQRILLPDEEPELDQLSAILKTFNHHFGDISWDDTDRVRQLLTETIPTCAARDGPLGP